MNTQRSILANAFLLVVLLCAAPATGQADRDQLKHRFEERYPRLVQLKQAGRVGETWGGFLDVVEPRFRDDESVKTLVEEENRDRRALYALLAEELKAQLEEPERSKMTPQVAAERNAWRTCEKASDTEKLGVAEGIWVTKKDRPWLLQLLDLESKGQVGETMAGYVAAVRGDARDATLKSVVDRENQARRKLYESLAQARRAPVETVAREHAQRYYKSAHIGVQLQKPDGSWAPNAPGPG
jgi:uncharacterized protein YdbL (DUF1318 family)